MKNGSGRAITAGCFAWIMICLVLGGGGYWGYLQWQLRHDKPGPEEIVLEELEKGFEVALEKRRLDEAEEMLVRLKAAGASPEVLQEARFKVARGRAEEKGQEITFLVLNARSALEAGQLSEAERYCSQVEVLRASHPAIAEIRVAIEESRLEVRTKLMVGAIEKALEDEEWATALKQLTALEKANPGDPQIAGIREKLRQAKEESERRRVRASELVAKARFLDPGTYSDEVMRLVEEAVRLNPSEENRALYKRMASYGKVMKVPGDYPTITAALKVSKAKDRVMVAKGTYLESLVVPNGVALVGEDREGTIIECPAKLGAVVTVAQDAKGVRLSSLTLRHSGLVNDEERFAIVTVNGGDLEGDDLVVVRASGHGVAVLNGGKVQLRRCEIRDSGWDGVAATGEGSVAILSKVTSEKNLQHGVDFWDGASGRVSESILKENGLNGLLVIGASQAVLIEKTKSEKNREVGIFVSGGVATTVKSCEIHGNLLGGVFLGGESRGIRLTGNQVTRNGEAGMVMEKGAEILGEENNLVKENEGRQIWRDAVFPEAPGVQTGAPPPAPPLEKDEDERAE